MPAALMPRPWDFPPPPPPHPHSISAMTKGSSQPDSTSIGGQLLDAPLPPLPPTSRASLPGHTLVTPNLGNSNLNARDTSQLGEAVEMKHGTNGGEDGDVDISPTGTGLIPPALTLTHPTLPRGFGMSHITTAVPPA